VARDKALHELVITAPGHEAHREMLTFDRDQSLTIMLEAQETTRRRSVARPEPTPSSDTTAQVDAPAEPHQEDKLEPGMDFRRIGAATPPADIVLEEDPYQ
jgi:hypothetical protein